MRKLAFAVAVLVGCCAPARADTLPLVEGLPATYTPGQAFTFTLRVPQLADFTNYTLELVFSTAVSDPDLLAGPAVAPADRYVFPSSANFGFQYDAPPGAQEVRLTISDSIAPDGVLTLPGQNDTLATITVTPGATLTGPITLSIGSNTSFGYNSEGGFIDPPADIPPIEQASPGGNNPVPAPPGAVLLGIGGLLFAARSYCSRPKAA
jgi:hypothetical protein